MSTESTPTNPPHKGAMVRYRLLAPAYRRRTDAIDDNGRQAPIEYLRAGEIIEVREGAPVSKTWQEVDLAGEDIKAPPRDTKPLPPTIDAVKKLERLKAAVDQARAKQPTPAQMQAIVDELAASSAVDATSPADVVEVENLRRRLLRMEHEAKGFEGMIRPLLIEKRAAEEEVRLCRIRDVDDSIRVVEADLIERARELEVELEVVFAELDGLCAEEAALRDPFVISDRMIPRRLTAFHGTQAEHTLERFSRGLQSLAGQAVHSAADAHRRPGQRESFAIFTANEANRRKAMKSRVVTKQLAARKEREARAAERRRRIAAGLPAEDPSEEG